MSFYGQQRFIASSSSGSSRRALARLPIDTSYEVHQRPGLGATPAPARFSPAVMRAAMDNLAFNSESRLQLQRALDRETVAAATMTDEQFWGYDQVWLNAGGATLRNFQQPGASGGGGRNMSWNNNQFWELGLPCSVDLFSSVMYQQRRYMAAQFRLIEHMRNAPDQRIIQGFDRAAAEPALGIREACGGASMRDKAQEWAYWAEHALKLIGVARWSSNFTWSRGTKSCAATPYRATPDDLNLVGSADMGNRYAPDMPDWFGCPTVGYVAGTSLRGSARYEALMSSRGRAEFVRGVNLRTEALEAASSWIIAPCEDRPSAGYPCRVRGMTPEPDYRTLISVAPVALSLHRSDLSPGGVTRVPTGPGDFGPGIREFAGSFKQFPAFLAPPGDESPGSWLYAFFLERGAPEAQTALRERSGFWFWRYRDRGFNVSASGLARGFARAVPAAELVLWQIVGWARDIIDKTFGQLVIEGFENLAAATLAIPEAFRTQPMTNASSVMAELSRRSRDETAQTIGGAFAAIAGVAAAINPIAGIVVTVIGAIVSALASFASDVGFVRAANPPALQLPAARVSPPTLAGGDDRCWVNPNPALESLAQFNERVAQPFAEAARRAAGNPAVMFDLIPRVREERRAGPARFDITATPDAPAFPWGPVALVTGVAILGVGTVVAIRRRKGRS